MEHEVAAGTALIKNGTLLPVELQFESEPRVPGWKVVTDLDARALDRAIRKAGWTFFSFAGTAKATAFGLDHDSMLRRAIGGIMARETSHRFNCLEILEVAFAGSGRFPLVRYLTLSAQWRHIQQSIIASSARKVSNRPLQPSELRSQDAAPAGGPALQRLIA
jgi:hypothetical protein